MVYVSLFSGAGFGDMGFREAGIAPDILCEIDPKRTAFTSRNFPNSQVLTCDVTQNIDLIVNHIKNKVITTGDEFFLLYATPPCQGMSKNGIGTILKAMAENKRSVIDERNRLYLPVIEVVKKTKPKWIFFENVCRLFNFNDVDKNGNVLPITSIIENEFREIGYSGRFELVQLADYGLPQTRSRSVGLFRFDENFLFEREQSFIPNKIIECPENRVKLRDVIINNEPLCATDKNKRVSKINPLHRVPKWRSELDFWMRNTPEGCSAFDNNNCISCDFVNDKADIFCKKCGELLPKPVIEKNGELHLIKGFVSSYKRMYWDKPASTVTTRSAYACSDHKVHPCENRVLSTYEVAVLQGINVNDVVWTDTSGKLYPDTLLRELIGECVPPMFTKIIGEHIKKIERSILIDFNLVNSKV